MEPTNPGAMGILKQIHLPVSWVVAVVWDSLVVKTTPT